MSWVFWVVGARLVFAVEPVVKFSVVVFTGESMFKVTAVEVVVSWVFLGSLYFVVFFFFRERLVNR